jgi:hypothetical protein
LPPISLTDDFEDPAIDAQWNKLGAATATESGGVLIMTPDASVNPERWGGYRSVASYEFAGKRLYVDLPQMVNTSSDAMAEFRIGSDDSNYYFLRERQGNLRFGVAVGGAEVTIQMVAYSSASQRYWQFRSKDGNLLADVSANGESWNNIGSTATSDVGTNLWVELRAGTDSSVADPGSLHADNVNLGHDCP